MGEALLANWGNFYVIVGSAAAGLTGLTFVVIALVSDAHPINAAGTRVFLTPTIVHFTAVILTAAYVSVPGQGPESLSVGFTGAGLAGVLYVTAIFVTMRHLGAAYVPVPEDWIWNVFLPALAYLTLCGVGIRCWRWPAQALYGVAGVSLLLLIIGIHNAWDVAVHSVMQLKNKKN
jgi:hypothetical protein